jgi:hypothetical protein
MDMSSYICKNLGKRFFFLYKSNKKAAIAMGDVKKKWCTKWREKGKQTSTQMTLQIISGPAKNNEQENDRP